MFHGTLDLDGAVPVAETAIQDVLFERGLYWASGHCGVINLIAAHKWFNLAAARGNRSALSYRLELAREMSCEQIAEAQKQAREWLQTH